MRAGFSSGSIEWTSIEESVGEGLSVLRGRTRTGKVGYASAMTNLLREVHRGKKALEI